MKTRVVLAFATACAAGCQVEPPPERWGGPTSAEVARLEEEEDSDPDEDTACEDGETRVCRVILAVHGKVTSCFEGVRICRDGAFGECTSPPVTP